MTRPQLLALLQDGRATNAGANDFMIKLSLASIAPSLTILKNLQAEGLIDNFTRCSPPEHECIDIYGYTGP